MNQWGNKEGRKVKWQRTPIHRNPPYVFTLTAWKVAKTTDHQRLIFKVQKLIEANFGVKIKKNFKNI
jgi:hypothetical protein